MKIGSFNLTDKNSKVLIIAELSANHNGSLDTAIETIKAAKRAGADCIKLQTYTADTLTIDSDKIDFKIKGTIWEGKTLYDLYKEAFTPWEWHERLFEEARKNDLLCFSSPFDITSVDFLEKLDVPAYKIASFEITDIPLIEYVASKGKPIIISTGIATMDDIALAVETCKKMNNHDVALLKCTSSYPAPLEDANLGMISAISENFGLPVGLSDHTLGSIAPIVAVSLGAKIIEKHFILDHSIGGPDASFSLDESEFTEMVINIRNAEKTLGNTLNNNSSIKGREFSRSLYVAEDINENEAITSKNIRSIRPGYGLHPKYFSEILGKRVNRKLEKGTAFSFKYINDFENRKDEHSYLPDF